jgi:hypothetical protein
MKFFALIIMVVFGAGAALTRYSGATKHRDRLIHLPRAWRDWVYGEGKYRR